VTHINDQELFRPDPDPRLHLAWGTVGWVGDPDVLDGLGKDEDDGVTLIKVTLFDGAAPTKRASDEGGANGQQVRVQASGPGWRVPPKGTRVMVGFANGDVLSPGNGLILGEVGVNPAKRFGRKKVLLDFGDADVVITGKSVSLVCDSNPDGEKDAGKRHVVSVSPDGGAQVVSGGSGLFVMGTNKAGDALGEVQIKAIDPNGNLKASLVLAQDSAGMFCSPTPATASGVNFKSGNATVTGMGCAIQTGSVSLGALASPATPVQVGPVAMSGVPSTAVFCAP
jgi:hypothetical protein